MGIKSGEFSLSLVAGMRLHHKNGLEPYLKLDLSRSERHIVDFMMLDSFSANEILKVVSELFSDEYSESLGKYGEGAAEAFSSISAKTETIAVWVRATLLNVCKNHHPAYVEWLDGMLTSK